MSATALEVLPAAERHLVSRFSYGVTPGLRDEVVAAGGARAWFEAQLALPVDAGVADWWPDLHRDAQDLWQRQQSKVRGGWEVMADYGRRVLVRRLVAAGQLREVMTEFWENLLHVPTSADAVFTYRADYGEQLRALALTSYDRLLSMAVTHPAMTIFLSGYDSTKAHPNENLGRELLELHTVGVGHHTEDDVKASARILTGHHVDMWRTFAASYRPEDHWTGPVRVLDFASDNADPDGRPVVQAYLSYLARHPLTARRLARRLAVVFVSDDPPASLVDRLATAYLTAGTAIAPVLRTLVDSPEFAAAVDAKLRTPAEDVVATYRLLGARLSPPTAADSAAQAILWQAEGLGQQPMTWPRPDGAPLTAAAWASPSRALASLNLHGDMAGGWWPDVDVTYRSLRSWAPATLPVTFAALVDHMARQLHHRPASPSLLEGACAATGLTPEAVVKETSDLFTWRGPRLIAAMLDHPTWFLR